MKTNDDVKLIGNVEIIKDYLDGEQEIINVQNTVLELGRRALARTLANNLNSQFDFYINRMIFGDGGTLNNVKRYVNANRQGLFGITQIIKPVIANIDVSVPTQVIFTSIIPFDEGVGLTLNEMGIQMANGSLYSMTTFPDLSKTSNMQITFNWRIQFV
jgi:hypothetical protein